MIKLIYNREQGKYGTIDTEKLQYVGTVANIGISNNLPGDLNATWYHSGIIVRTESTILNDFKPTYLLFTKVHGNRLNSSQIEELPKDVKSYDNGNIDKALIITEYQAIDYLKDQFDLDVLIQMFNLTRF